jgi:hypothetical protein
VTRGTVALVLRAAGLSAVLLLGAAPPSVSGFAAGECLATAAGAGVTGDGGASRAWVAGDPGARARACRDAERAHRERARWEAEYGVARSRARVRETAARFRAARDRAGMTMPTAGPAARAASGRSRLAPCPRPDATGECIATAEQILHQIQRSRAAAAANPRAPAMP